MPWPTYILWLSPFLLLFCFRFADQCQSSIHLQLSKSSNSPPHSHLRLPLGCVTRWHLSQITTLPAGRGIDSPPEDKLRNVHNEPSDRGEHACTRQNLTPRFRPVRTALRGLAVPLWLFQSRRRRTAGTRTTAHEKIATSAHGGSQFAHYPRESTSAVPSSVPTKRP